MKVLSIYLVWYLSAVVSASSQTPAPPITSPNLSAIAFLTKHEWAAKLPDTPDGKPREIHARFTWSQSGHAIRITNQFVIDGRTRPYLEGLYAWDPQQRVIAFWYVDADGSLTKGKVTTDGGKLIHEFDQVTPDGKSSSYVAKVTQYGEQAWDNEIFERHGAELKLMVKVRYEVVDSSP